MASGTSFKQQCPSCEAMVPIRDPGLIGKKIDCPKCKYRFVVEEPAGDEDDVDEVEEAEDKPARKKAPAGKAPAKGVKAGGKPGKKGASKDDDDDDDKPRPKKKKEAGGSGMLIAGIIVAVVAVLAVG